MAYGPTYHDLVVTPTAANGTNLGSFSVHYVEAGAPTLPTLILYHGFPSSSTQFRELIPLLSDKYHIFAPDFPAFGLTTAPSDFVFTFDNLAAVTSAWIAALHLTSYAIYIFDYGSPVGLRIAAEHPEQVKAIITQNGNAYKEGFGQEFWKPIFDLWNTSNSATAREVLRNNVLTLETTKYQYTAGVPEGDLPLIDPSLSYHSDFLANIQGSENQSHQLDLFYDYRNNVALYPRFHEYFRTSQVPLLAVWGKGDPAFIPPGAEAFKKDLPHAQIHLLDAGHFALETAKEDSARIIKDFLGGVNV